MRDKKIIRERLSWWQTRYEKLQDAYIALVEAGVSSYTIDDRQLTRLDISKIGKEIDEAEKKIDELSAAVEGRAPRKAFGIIPRDF